MKNLFSSIITALSIAATTAAWLYNSVIAVTFMKVLLCISVPIAIVLLAIIAIAVVFKPVESGEKLTTELKWYLWPWQFVTNANQIAATIYLLSLGSVWWALLSLVGFILSITSVAAILWAMNKYKETAKRSLKRAMAEEQYRYDNAKPANVISVE
jgi:hypothetical protein